MGEKISRESIASQIELFKQSQGMNTAELARWLGIPRYTLIRWQDKLVGISPMMLRYLCSRGVVRGGEKREKK